MQVGQIYPNRQPEQNDENEVDMPSEAAYADEGEGEQQPRRRTSFKPKFSGIRNEVEVNTPEEDWNGEEEAQQQAPPKKPRSYGFSPSFLHLPTRRRPAEVAATEEPAYIKATGSSKPLREINRGELGKLEGGNWGFFVLPDHNNLINLKMSKPFAIKRINDQVNRKTIAIFQIKQKGGLTGKKFQTIEVPFNDRLAFPTNSGGWLAFFNLKYKQTVLTKDELIRQQQVNLDSESERAEELMAAVYNAKQLMFQKPESF